MKYVIAAVLIFCMNMIAIKSISQIPRISIYGHALYAIPLDGSSKEFYNGGVGVVGGILAGRKTTMFNGSIGYSHFFADKANTFGDETYVPVKVGVRQYIPLTLHFLYAQADMGMGFITHKNGDNYSPFAFDFGAGVKFAAFEAALIWDNYHKKNPSGMSSWLTVQAGIIF